MRHQYFVWMLMLLCSVCLFSSCEHKRGGEPDGPEVVEEPDSNHTLLIYMIGDNNLSEYCLENTSNSIRGLLDSPHPLNLVIYEDSYVSGVGGKPVLFRLKRNAVDKQRVDTTYLQQYPEDWDSTDPEVMKTVVNEVFKKYDTEVKGIELWSHAMGWIPSSSFRPSQSRTTGFEQDDVEPETRSSQHVGLDVNKEMDIWVLRETLEKCPHLDYILYDACNMGQAEVAYELRDVADYMLACPTEIMAGGLPYHLMIRSLSTCQGKSSLLNALKMVVDDFASLYDGTTKFDDFMVQSSHRRNYKHDGTFALTDLHQIKGVHDAFVSLRANYAERVQLLQDHYYTYEGNITHYGRTGMGSRYYFYDLLDAARFFVGDDKESNSLALLEQALDKAVIKEHHTESFIEISNIRSCGLGVGLPEMFQASTNTNTLHAAYAKLRWSQE